MTEEGVCINLDNWQRQTFAEFQQRESARREWLLNNPFVFEMAVRSITEGGEVSRDEGRLIVKIQNRSYEDLYLEWITVAFTQRDRIIGAKDIEFGIIIPARDELEFDYKMDLPAAARSPYGITPEVVNGAYYLD